MEKRIFVTTSWDDGLKADLKLASLLRKYNLPATFYISRNPAGGGLSDDEIKDLAKDFEIGAHTIYHPNLDLIPIQKAEFEIKESKKWLEGLLTKDIIMFAYPRGRFNTDVKHLVEDAGFLGARTVEEFKFDLSRDPFEMPTSLQASPYPWRKREGGKLSFSKGLLGFQPRRYVKSLGLMLKPSSYLGFSNLAKGMFDKVKKDGGIFHLWGHSKEIEKFNMWQELEDVFASVAKKNDVIYLDNGDLIKKYFPSKHS